MRYAALLLLVCSSLAGAQQSMRQQASELLMNVYLRERVQLACKNGAAEVMERIDGPGSEFPVSCAARRQFFEAVVQFYRGPEVTSACDAEPSDTVTVSLAVPGSTIAVPVDCARRARELPLIETWLK